MLTFKFINLPEKRERHILDLSVFDDIKQFVFMKGPLKRA